MRLEVFNLEKTLGLKDNLKIAKRGGNVSKIARETYELETGNSAITNKNNTNIRYIENNKQLK